VAATLNFFPGAIVLAWEHRLRLVGGWRKGGESPSCGGSRSMGRASVVSWRGTCRGVGGTFPRPGFPLGGNGKGGLDSTLSQWAWGTRIVMKTRANLGSIQ